MARQLDDKVMVAGQIAPSAVPEFAAQGVSLLVNNRADHEEPGQPTSAEIEAAAQAAGIGYRHNPIIRGMGPSDVEAMREAICSSDQGKVLLFCRSGTRSVLAWALARAADGMPRGEIERRAEEAGYSLAPVAHLL